MSKFSFRPFLAQDAISDHVVTHEMMVDLARKYQDRAPGELKAAMNQLSWNPNTIDETMALHNAVQRGARDKDFEKFKKYEKA